MDFSSVPSTSKSKILANLDQSPNPSSLSSNKKFRCFTQENNNLINSSTKDHVSLLSPEITPFENSRSESLLSTPKADFIIENVIFKGEKEFIDQAKCEVCSIEFSSKFGLKAFKKKFCFVCGHATCRICSKRKINGKRVCDLCLLRYRSKNAEIRKKEVLMLAEKRIENLRDDIEKNKTWKVVLIKEIGEIRLKSETDHQEQKKGLDSLEKTMEGKKLQEYDYQQKLKYLREELQSKKREEKAAKQELEETQRKTEGLRKKVTEAKLTFSQKIQEFQQLKKHREDMECSESFVSMMKSKSLQSHERKTVLNNNINDGNANKSLLDASERKTTGQKNSKKSNNYENCENSIERSYKERKSSILNPESAKKPHKNTNVTKEIKGCYPYPCT